MSLLSRTTRVALGLILLGAVVGAFVGSGIFLIAIAPQGPSWPDLWMAIRIGTPLGGFFGALFAPGLGFQPFRHILIGRALVAMIVWPLLGAAVGTAIGPIWAVAFALVGLLIGGAWATRKRWAHRART